MIIYSKEQRFSPKTGRELEPDYAESGLICDYTGRAIDMDEYEFRPMYSIKINYDHSCETVFSEDEDRQYFQKAGIEYSSLFESEFSFLVGDNGQDFSCNLLDEWSKGFSVEKSLFYQCLTVEEAFRRARARIAKKLLEEKKYSKEELGLRDYL